MAWEPYKSLGSAHFTATDFAETLDGGQSFTWDRIGDGEYEGVFDGRAVRVRILGNGTLEYSCLSGTGGDVKSALAEYLDFGRDYASIRQQLFETGDVIMHGALEIYPTLRILRQNPAEATICFICSSSKRILQIKQCVKLLSEKLGERIGGGKYCMPSFARIADADIDTLRACKLGFRANYLKKSAEKIVDDKFDPMSLREMPYAEAKKYLTSLRGIGEKVADCILLFGASRFEAFPVDTWIRQAMCELYSTPDDPNYMRKFAAEKFGENAGFAQQLIFAAKRKNLL